MMAKTMANAAIQSSAAIPRAFFRIHSREQTVMIEMMVMTMVTERISFH
jgi:hypothetical protein